MIRFDETDARHTKIRDTLAKMKSEAKILFHERHATKPPEIPGYMASKKQERNTGIRICLF
jgi:hypothetical protein